jgi:uncharacterized SAM-binding protein YcdF (DUF218 family)
MSKSDLRKVRLRFVILAVVIAVCAIVSNRHIASIGAVYEYPLEGYPGVKASDLQVSASPVDLAEITEVRDGPNHMPVAVIHGKQPGEGMLLVNAGDMGGASMLRVYDNGTVLVDGANFNGWEALPISVAICLGTAGVLCMWAVLSLHARAWYGYEMAAYAGGALFFLVEAASFAWLMVSGSAKTFIDFAIAVTDLADQFVMLSLVPMALVCVFVCASNVALIRHEGLRPVNLLGIGMSVAWALACLVIFFMNRAIFDALAINTVFVLGAIDSVIAIGVSFGLCLFAGTCACAWAASKHRPSFPRDYLVILGCGLRADGTPTPLLASRVNAALAYATAQEGEGYGAPTFVPSGGQGADEPWPEAESMRQYLADKGVPNDRILPEDKSVNTRQNLLLSARVIAGASSGAVQPRIAFATTNYHVFRGYVYAHDAGLAAEGISAPTKLYFWPNAFLREFVGLLVSRWLPIALAYVAVASLYLASEYALLVA